jgi:hypothetical protein
MVFFGEMCFDPEFSKFSTSGHNSLPRGPICSSSTGQLFDWIQLLGFWILLPGFKISSDQVFFQTILRKLINGILIYRQTLIGHILGLLDYFVKGFINSGFFPEDFVDSWRLKMVDHPVVLNS